MINFIPIEIIPLGPIKISVHGLFIAIGIFTAYVLSFRQARRLKLSAEIVDGMTLWGALLGVVGSRLFYIILNPQYYSSVADMLKIWEGGLVSFGGLVGGFFGVFAYIRYKKADFLKYADLLSPYVLLGWGIARVGDFLSWSFGEYGTPSTLPWAIQVGNDLPRHPNQLYSLFLLALGFLVLRWLQKNDEREKAKRFVGYYFFFAGVWYFAKRFLTEFVREYPLHDSWIFYRDFAQWMSVGGICVFLFLWYYKRKKISRN